jgi:hypothetical protein
VPAVQERTKAPAEAPARSGSSAPSRIKAHLIANLDMYIAGLAALLFAGGLLTTDELFLGSGTDIVSMEYPLHSFATGWMSEGVLPLWNPYILGGVPFQAGIHGYLYPGAWTGVFLPTGFDIKLGIVLHLIVAALGGAFLARGRTSRRPASCLAGLTYGLSAFAISHLFAGHRVLVATAAWLPWVIGAIDRAARGERRYLVIGAALSGLMLLCGHYQVVYIGMGGALAFLLLDRLLAPRDDGSVRSRLIDTGKAAAVWAALLAAGALIAAVQILPMLQMIDLSQRSSGGAEFAGSFSSAVPNLLSYLWPNLFGNKVDAPFVGGWSYWESLGYLGLVPTALIAFGALALPWRRSIPALALIALGTVLALGSRSWLFEWFVAIAPGSDLFRAAGRYCLLATLFGALLAGQALDAWLDDNLSRKRRITGLIAAAATALVAVLFGLWIGSHDAASWSEWLATLDPIKDLSGASSSKLGELRNLAGGDALKAGVVLTLAAGLLLAGGRPRLRRWAAIALVVLAAVDLFQFGRRFLETAPRERFEWPEEVGEILTESGPHARALTAPELHAPNHPMLAGASTAAGYDIFLDERYARYLNRAAGRDEDVYLSYVHVRRYSRLIDHLGVEYVLTGMPLRDGRSRTMRGFDRFERTGRHGGLMVYRNPAPTPRAAIVHRVELTESEEQTLELMESPSFDLREVALVEQDVGEIEQPTGDERVEITLYEPNRVEIEVVAASGGLLVLSDTLHPGWSAAVDGEPAPLYRANYVMRAVPVAAGEHTVVMTYLPGSFTAGAIVSLLAVAALIGVVVAARRRRKS